MLRLKAFRPSGEKIVKIQVHPTHPWLVTADNSDHVSVWNWEHRQVVYELKAGGVDQRRLVGAKLEKLAEGELDSRGKPTEAIKGGSVKQVAFYDDDVDIWKDWANRAAAAEANAASIATSGVSSISAATKGRHFLVICCEYKAVFLDLVTMRGRDVTKQELDNKSLTCMEFLSRSSASEGPLVAFGGSDGLIRAVSMMTWKLVRRYSGGHKGAINCLMTFMAISGEAMLVSGGHDGLLIFWSADDSHDSWDFVPESSLKAHDGGVVAVELLRISGGAPQLVTIGADKTLAIWDTISFKEIRRIKPVPKMACHSVASWCHPRAPNLDILTCVKDSHIWANEYPTVSTRPLCELSCLVPPLALSSSKKLRVYCMVAHPLQPHLVATGTNIGTIITELDFRALPPVAALPSPAGSREHSAVFVLGRELKLLNFKLSDKANPLGNKESLKASASSKGDSEALQVNQTKKHIGASAPHDSYSVLSLSSSGKYLAAVWPDVSFFAIYKVSDWSIVDSGGAQLLAWDACRDRFAILKSSVAPRNPIAYRGGYSRKSKEAAAAAAANSGAVQVRILLDDGTSNVLMRNISERREPVIGLHGGALLGVAYRTSHRAIAAAMSTFQSMQSSSFGSGASSFNTYDDGFSSSCPSAEWSPQNFQLYSWETFQPIGSLLPQPEWTAWDQTVEYCAFGYERYIVISSLRPQYRYLGDVAIPYATSAVWHRRQLFVATPTTVEVVFVDAGVALIDIETKRMKEEQKLREAQAMAFAQHGELALISVDGPKVDTNERISLRPPMLQVVRLASYQHTSSVPSYLTLPRLSKIDGDDARPPEERQVEEVAVAGGGVAVAVTRFPAQQKRPIGPLMILGVRDGVLWLIDRYIQAHAISLSHPGIRCRCLAAYGDAVSAVKWATRLAREHHDDLAQFMLGMGYAAEALHLPGISKRLEFDLAMQGNDLKRALQCLLTMSNSRDIGQETAGLDLTNLLNVAVKKENVADAVKGIAKFAKQFFDLIDDADATAQGDIAREALKRLAAAGSVKGALQIHDLRGLALRLANHGELTRLNTLVNNLISLGLGREAAFASAVLGDNDLMEKAWKETGMLAEAVLHSHAHGRPTVRNLVDTWNKALQREIEHTRQKKTDATAAFLASLEDPNLPRLENMNKKPPIEILPPGMTFLSPSISAPKKPTPAEKGSSQSQQEPEKPLLLDAPPASAPPPSESGNPCGGPPAEDSNQPGSQSEAASSLTEAASSTDSGQPALPSADNSNETATKSTPTPPDSVEPGAPVAGDAKVASQSAESTQSEASLPTDSNQQPPAVPSSDGTQPMAQPSAGVGQPQAPTPGNANQPPALPPSDSNEPGSQPSVDVVQPRAPPSGDVNQQTEAPPPGELKQPLALPPADVHQSQSIPPAGLSPNQSQVVPPSGSNQPQCLPLAAMKEQKQQQPKAQPSAGFDPSQNLPSSGSNQPLALAYASPGVDQTQGPPPVDVKQSQVISHAGLSLNQSQLPPISGSNQSQGLPLSVMKQQQPSAGFDPSQGLPSSAGLNQPLALACASPGVAQTQGLPSVYINQPPALPASGLSQSQGFPSASLQNNPPLNPPAVLNQPLMPSTGLNHPQLIHPSGPNQPLTCTSSDFDQSQRPSSVDLNQPINLPAAGIYQPLALPTPGLNPPQAGLLNQPQTLLQAELNQIQGLPSSDVNKPVAPPPANSSLPVFLQDAKASGPPFVDAADFLGTKENNQTSASTSTASPLGGLEQLL